MLEAAVALPAAIWVAVAGFFTPAVLFLLLNLVIGTIAVTSFKSSSTALHSDSPAAAGGSPLSKLGRSPSLVLDRLRSFKLHSSPSRAPPPETLTAADQKPETLTVRQSDAEPEAEPVHESEHHIARSRSDTQPAAGEMPERLARKLKKSASVKSAFKHFGFVGGEDGEEEVAAAVKRGPLSARESMREEEEEEEEAEVDARADDFINRFRQQLKLQRLDSFARYKDMLCRGSAN